jgi:hypothetical protein
MGRSGIPLSQFITEEGLEDELWLPLGKGEWTNLEGPVSRCGTCHNMSCFSVTPQCVNQCACCVESLG